MVAIIEVLNGPSIKDKGQMESEWIRRSGSSRPTYFRYLQTLPPDLKAKAEAMPKAKASPKVQAVAASNKKARSKANTPPSPGP